VVALFVETCGPLDPWIYHHQISIFGVFLMENVYKNKPYTLEELKQNIELCISKVTEETLHQVASYMRKRVNACISEHGGLSQHLI
jgi:hypothetical protein